MIPNALRDPVEEETAATPPRAPLDQLSEKEAKKREKLEKREKKEQERLREKAAKHPRKIAEKAAEHVAASHAAKAEAERSAEKQLREQLKRKEKAAAEKDSDPSMYDRFCAYSFIELEQLLRQAETREERAFYRSLLNLKLQIEQEKVIGEVLL